MVSLLLLISCVRHDFLAILVALLLLTLPRRRGDDVTSACNFLPPLPSCKPEEVSGMLRLIAQAEGILTLSCCLHHSQGNCVYPIYIYILFIFMIMQIENSVNKRCIGSILYPIFIHRHFIKVVLLPNLTISHISI